MKGTVKPNKGLAIGIGIAAAVVVIAVLAALFLRKDTGFRTLQVYQLDGQAEVKRDSSVITPYVNMMLENGDYISTFEESYLYLKMDEDKYLMAEPHTGFGLEASGSSQNSKTVIRLDQGAVVNHITTPLSKQSSYEVTTPNSTMAVRGTSFRVYVWLDENGVSHTLLQVFEGVVEVHLLYPDGSVSQEGRKFSAGQEASIWGNDETSDYDQTESDIDYYALDIPTLEFLKVGISNGVDEYALTIPDVDEIIRIKQSYFDVTFMTDGRVFGTQKVLFDHCAAQPSLRPGASGSWDFDFSTPIREKTQVQWKN